jgi:predicted nucleic acid-binding Zn ribbon protein
VPPIDHLCSDCGSSFEVGLRSLVSDDVRLRCPQCRSDAVRTDWNAVSARFSNLVEPDVSAVTAVPPGSDPK